MSESIKAPEGASKKVTLETGRVLYFRAPKFSDLRQASQIASNDGGFEPLKYLEEIIQILAIALYRNNGEEVDITNKNKFFDETLTLGEGQQLLQNPELLGIELKKKAPKVEAL